MISLHLGLKKISAIEPKYKPFGGGGGLSQ
jgi:hypothetical protein